ncbi:thylakoid membrane protein TERC, chloroplastic isoform X2 [Mercurialis annua]|uniref:thylakoid membrane protein TERC, chloroplastic isoform X2 n=1 Tax=Mercurialis annua TaxID=3986 RepID=UPI0024AEBE10|nr:thylakoid membrane protein TERC, chloroplastic isoform X2 [Mercurialis annua]
MGLASAIYTTTFQPPLNKFDPVSLRVSPPKSTRFHLSPSPSFTIHLHNHRVPHYYHPIACSNGTQHDNDFSTSEPPHSLDEPDEIDTTDPHGDYTTSVKTVALCVCTAVAFGIGIGFIDGVGKASEFFAGYILEQSLSVDNLFVFVLIFKYFKVPLMYQNRVLSFGIAGAIIFRLSLILLGAATLQRFEAVNLFLAAILLYSSFKLFASEDDDTDLSDNFVVKTCQKYIPVTSNYDGNRFFTNQDGVWKATPLLLTVAVIELSDIAFAVDSIPAVFGVTRDPFIVCSSNLFAILGLRSLYTLISASMAELEYLQGFMYQRRHRLVLLQQAFAQAWC